MHEAVTMQQIRRGGPTDMVSSLHIFQRNMKINLFWKAFKGIWLFSLNM